VAKPETLKRILTEQHIDKNNVKKINGGYENVNNKSTKKKKAEYLLRAVIFAILSALIATPLQVLTSVFILKEKGPPDVSFLIPIGIIGFITKTLFAMAYVLLGNKLPIKNSKLRAFTFIGLIWISVYLPQVLGMARADGPIAEAAFKIPLLICDSLSFIIDGILLGLLFKEFPYHTLLPCSKSALIRTMFISAISFPAVTIIFEFLLGKIFPTLYIYNTMQVSNEKLKIFYVIFYACFIITGASLPIFYRLTEYNTGKQTSALRFGIIYSICLWSPIVAIMIAFGTSVLLTLVYVVVFIICIITISVINGKLIEKFNVKRNIFDKI